MASSLFHHNDKLEAINRFVNSKQWPDIFDYGHKISSGEELDNPKEHRVFWEKLRKDVMKGSVQHSTPNTKTSSQVYKLALFVSSFLKKYQA